MKPLIRTSLALAGAVLLSFCGSSGGGNPDGGGGGPVSVAGQVVNINGLARTGLPIVIKSGTSFSKSTITDANGNFSAADVPVPYDVTIVVNGSTDKGATVYVGLTTATPVLIDLINGSSATSRTASLSGTITGGIGFPTPSGTQTDVLFESPEAQGSSSTTTGPYSFNSSNSNDVRWYGPATTTGSLYVLQWQSGPNGPASYSGYGTKSGVALVDMGTVSGQDVALSAVTAAAVSGTYTPPTGYTVSRKELLVRIGTAKGSFFVGSDSTASNAFSFVTPAISGATVTLSARAQDATGAQSFGFKANLATNAGGVAASSPAAATLTLPANSATAVTTTTPFTWTGTSGAVNILFTASTTSGNPRYYVFTAGTTATLPDLSASGIAFPSSAGYQWEVVGVGPFATVDAAATGLLDLIGYGRTDGFETQSTIRSFTTAP